MSLVTFYCRECHLDDQLLGEVSLNEYTARQLVTALSLQQPGDSLGGSVATEGIPPLLRRLLFLMNTPTARQPFLRASKVSPKPRVIDCPETGLPRIVRPPKTFGGELSDEGVVRRLVEIHDLLTMALEFECGIYWG